MSSRSRWKFVAVLAAVLVVLMIGFWLLVGRMRERKVYVSSVDPISGFRCRFTLSSDWKRGTPMPDLPDSVGEYESFAPSPIPIRLWIDSHILHKSPPHASMILFTDGNLKTFSRMIHLVAGYPEMATVTTERIIAHRHLMIDGYPATVFTASAPQKSAYGTTLFVYVPNNSIAYVVTGGGSDSDSAQIDREMQAIISSFHVEKVTGGKR